MSETVHGTLILLLYLTIAFILHRNAKFCRKKNENLRKIHELGLRIMLNTGLV